MSVSLLWRFAISSCDCPRSLVNLTCGRNPWKQACPSDETFRAYLSNPDFLRSILPISKQCNELLKRIFALNPASRISIKELKAEVKRMTRWTMTFEELRYATRATKEAARAWAPAHILDEPSMAEPTPAKCPSPAPVQHNNNNTTTPHAATRPKIHRDVFDTTDSSTVSSVDSAVEWRRMQQQEQLLQQSHQRQQARQQYASPVVPSPITSPSSSSAYQEPLPQPVIKPSPVTVVPKSIINMRSNFSLSDSEDTSSDEDEEMPYAGRSQAYTSKNRLQEQSHHTSHQQKYNTTIPTKQHDYATRSRKVTPPPLAEQAPRTPRPLFSSQPHRQRKQSIESTSSSSSASSDASWTGLPPTPDTPIFTKRPQGAEVAQEKTPTRGFSLGNTKLKLF